MKRLIKKYETEGTQLTNSENMILRAYYNEYTISDELVFNNMTTVYPVDIKDLVKTLRENEIKSFIVDNPTTNLQEWIIDFIQEDVKLAGPATYEIKQWDKNETATGLLFNL